jgi:hypothetical protein
MSVTMRQMLEAGVHFGHQTRYWNPKMSDYIFGQRNKIHIVNLEKTMELYQEAMKYIRQLRVKQGHGTFCRHQTAGARDRRRGSEGGAECLMSTPDGWAACSPTSRRSSNRSSA